MKEAEVSLRVALFYIMNDLTDKDVSVSIDGAQIKTGNTVHFDIYSFVNNIGLQKIDGDIEKWQGEYRLGDYKSKLIIHSKPGVGDVQISLSNGKMLYVESKKGQGNSSNKTTAYALMREAIGQLMTCEGYNNNMELAVAVPYSNKSYELALRWSKLKQLQLIDIKFLLVQDDNKIKFI